MSFLVPLSRHFALGIAYFAAASLAVSLTRYDGGVACLWIASAFLIAELLVRRRRTWAAPLVICAVASAAATGLFGLGWALAPMFVAINLGEACIAAWVLSPRGRQSQPLGSLSWLFRFVAAVGIAAPLAGAVVAAATLWSIGKPPGPALLNYFAGHALGNVTFTPLALLVARGNLGRLLRDARRRDTMESVSLLLLVLVVSLIVFQQTSFPLLFLPVLPIILVTFRLGRGGAAVAIVVLALVGGGSTLAGLGPIQLIDAPLGMQVQYFQFYLAATVLTVLPVAADLENRRRLHRALRVSEERYRLLAEHSTDILMQIDLEGRIRFVSPSIRQLGGYDPASLIGRKGRILIAPEHVDRVVREHATTIAAAGKTHTYEYLALTDDGHARWFETNARAIVDERGAIESVLTIARDISARKAIERRLTTDAMTDPLTGLPNRRAFDAAVSRRPIEASNDRSDCVALLDLDHFKVINDSFGHDVGDRVLRDFARLARRIVRERDFVARMGGEEFAIFFPDTPVAQALLVCDRLRHEMAHTDLSVGSATVRVTVSGGVGQIGPQGVAEALKNADIALYEAKRGGRDRFALAA